MKLKYASSNRRAPRLVFMAPTARGLTLRSIAWPLALTLSLCLGVAAYAIATYPLYPRMYLSPTVEAYPGLADLLLRLYSTSTARAAVEGTDGNVFFYMYAIATLWLFGVYLLALLYAHRARARVQHLRWAIGSAALASLLFIFAPTLFTSDLFSYSIYGRIAAVYGGNPLITPPNRFPFDPVYPLLYWRDVVSVYGPLWVSLSSLLMAGVPPLIGEQVAVFKVVAAVFHLANAALIWRILKHLAPRSQLFGALLYLWNPLLLVEFAANGHNDAVMIFLILMSVESMMKRQTIRPLVFLAGAVLTKWIAALLVPIYIIVVLRNQTSWRMRAGFLLGGATSVFVAAAALYWPYWAGLATVTEMFNSSAAERLLNSPSEMMIGTVTEWLQALPYVGALIDDKIATLILKSALGAIFVAYLIAETARVHRLKDIPRAWLRVLFAYLTIACFWFWPWYVSWLMPLAALGGWNRLAKAALIFTVSSFLFYVVWPGAPLRPFEPYYAYRAVALFVPPLLYLAISARPGWRRSEPTTNQSAVGKTA